ncbi:chromatin-remodeling complex subunit ies6 [Microbotryomycetes sp. JL201]|nr:chromatin-remodeling complex subunit ies6 [Microbotryomycetes sp. JL201]
MSYAETWRPFKNHQFFAQRAASSKRNKNLKQLLIIERERVEQKLQHQKLEREREPDKIQPEVVSFMTVDAAPSVIPPKKYCDITGLEGKYVDPNSTLRYHNAEVYEVIKTFQPGVSQAYLSLRGQGVVLR